MDVVEFAGLTHEAASLIESFRAAPSETKSDIIVRVLKHRRSRIENRRAPEPDFDLGQGARLRVGERLHLFLSEESKRLRQPEAVAEVRCDGIYMDGKRVTPSRGRQLQPAMLAIQQKLNHRNAKGEIISLSAWRQWNVERDGKLLRIDELKDPKLAHKRGRAVTGTTPLPAEALGF